MSTYLRDSRLVSREIKGGKFFVDLRLSAGAGCRKGAMNCHSENEAGLTRSREGREAGRNVASPNVAQSARVLDGLVWLMSVIPTGIGLVALVLFALYPLNEAKMALIASDLKARRVAAGENDPAAAGAG